MRKILPKSKILWLSWKDHQHPHAGGAELVKQEICKRLVRDGHDVIVFTARYKGSAKSEVFPDGTRVIRRGNRLTVYYFAYRYYKKYLKKWPTVVIDEVNTIPFFASVYTKKPTVHFFHQLAREIWYKEVNFIFANIGYIMEAVYLKLLSRGKVITVSPSSRDDLLKYGFKKQNIRIITEGIVLKRQQKLPVTSKPADPTLLYFGSIRAMKQVHHIVEAFELAKIKIPNLKLIIAGSHNSKYGQKLLKKINKSKFVNDIKVLGRVAEDQKAKIMQDAHFICVTSIKEGWGLIVTESAGQGTPAIVYDVDGLRDAVKRGRTGLLSRANVHDFSKKIIEAFSPKFAYQKVRTDAYYETRINNFENSYQDFCRSISELTINR